jgi:uncharacterized protein
MSDAKYFAVWATDHAGMLDQRLRVREAHRARLRDPGMHQVKVIAGGPTLDDADVAMNGSLLVVQADEIDAVRRFVAEDPYALAGVYASVEVRPWQWSLGRPAPDEAAR